ncbi:MAG: hypothetical protein WCL02_01110 [bacterium]
MKKIIVVIASILGIQYSVLSQDSINISNRNYSLTEVSITSGKGALTSGFDTRFDFSNGKSGVLFLQANNDRAAVHFGKKFGNIQLIESFGVFKNIPWTGPMIVYTLGPLDFIAWNGIGFAKTNTLKDPGYTPQFFFSYEGVGLTFLKNNRLSGALMYFGTDPMNWFISYKRTIIIGKRSKFFGEVTYNHALDIPMFVIGYTIKLQ